MTTKSPPRAIETLYAGCRFRSRLEARWAVFFDHLRVRWEYEPQGFLIAGRPYLPDFLLPDCSTWVEVKGDEASLDEGLMLAAAEHLPRPTPRRDPGPRILILGPIPTPRPDGDWGWVGLDVDHDPYHGEIVNDRWFGFGSYHKNLRPSLLCNTSTATPVNSGCGDYLTPALDPDESGVPDSYAAARSARFEHGGRR